MKITEITVHAGRTVNHPLEQYSNLKPSLSIKAVLADDDDPKVCIERLQAQAETQIEEHKHRLIADIKALDYRMRQKADLESAERELTRLQDRINAARASLTAPPEELAAIDATDEPPSFGEYGEDEYPKRRY